MIDHNTTSSYIGDIEVTQNSQGKEDYLSVVYKEGFYKNPLSKKQYDQVKDRIVAYRFSRRHGLQCPFAFKQIILILFMATNEGFIIYWFIKTDLALWLFILNSTFFIMAVYFGVMAALIDPTDNAIYHQRLLGDITSDNEGIFIIHNELGFKCSVCELRI